MLGKIFPDTIVGQVVVMFDAYMCASKTRCGQRQVCLDLGHRILICTFLQMDTDNIDYLVIINEAKRSKSLGLKIS